MDTIGIVATLMHMGVVEDEARMLGRYMSAIATRHWFVSMVGTNVRVCTNDEQDVYAEFELSGEFHYTRLANGFMPTIEYLMRFSADMETITWRKTNTRA